MNMKINQEFFKEIYIYIYILKGRHFQLLTQKKGLGLIAQKLQANKKKISAI